MQNAILTRRPSYVIDAVKIMDEINMEKAEVKTSESINGKKVILQSEDDIFLREKSLKNCPEKKEGVDVRIEDKKNNEGV